MPDIPIPISYFGPPRRKHTRLNQLGRIASLNISSAT